MGYKWDAASHSKMGNKWVERRQMGCQLPTKIISDLQWNVTVSQIYREKKLLIRIKRSKFRTGLDPGCRFISAIPVYIIYDPYSLQFKGTIP